MLQLALSVPGALDRHVVRLTLECRSGLEGVVQWDHDHLGVAAVAAIVVGTFLVVVRVVVRLSVKTPRSSLASAVFGPSAEFFIAVDLSDVSIQRIAVVVQESSTTSPFLTAG